MASSSQGYGECFTKVSHVCFFINDDNSSVKMDIIVQTQAAPMVANPPSPNMLIDSSLVMKVRTPLGDDGGMMLTTI